MFTQVVVEPCVWDRVFRFYAGVKRKYPNTWTQKDTVRQIKKLRSVVSPETFPAITQWSREPYEEEWRQKGYRETWQKGNPWHFAYSLQTVGRIDVYTIYDIEHEDFITEEDTEI